MGGIVDFVLLGAILLAAVLVIIRKINRIKEKGFGCDGGCEGCSAGCKRNVTKDKGDF